MRNNLEKKQADLRSFLVERNNCYRQKILLFAIWHPHKIVLWNYPCDTSSHWFGHLVNYHFIFITTQWISLKFLQTHWQHKDYAKLMTPFFHNEWFQNICVLYRLLTCTKTLSYILVSKVVDYLYLTQMLNFSKMIKGI